MFIFNDPHMDHQLVEILSILSRNSALLPLYTAAFEMAA